MLFTPALHNNGDQLEFRPKLQIKVRWTLAHVSGAEEKKRRLL